VEVVLHGAEPEELRDEATVGAPSGPHDGASLELVDQIGERCSVDARD
jgi:hypothetical protein